MKQFVYNNYYKVIIFFAVLALINLYVIFNYDTGSLGGFLFGMFSAISAGLLISPKKEYLKKIKNNG